MPKVKPYTYEEKQRLVRKVISGNMEVQALSEDEIAVKMHITKRTFQNKRRRPETFSLDELWKLSELLKFSEEEKVQIL
uniref:SOS-response transcriptional repressor n=1 Tax=Siphoviridae sp. ctWDo30 TaxID=2826360 RepID=A0A8S5N5Y5_9CAUD|nr:MAG TPA: SOS-response transcriptional repressor [Siphoviridae sp. ctWDo30]